MTEDPRAELADLARSLRALLEVHDAAGTWGLPPGEPALRAARPEPPAAPEPRAPEPRAPAPPPMARPVFAPPPDAAPRPAEASPATATWGAMAAPERTARLAVLADEARACSRCPLHAARLQAVFSRGSPTAELCFVGEGPGADEDEQGEPFVGKAGQLLDKMIQAMTFSRDEVYVCNVVKCRPPNNRKPELDEMAACTPYLAEQLEIVGPRVIVALGATAVQGLLGTTEGITRLRGKWKLYKGRVPVMPTFHPAYLLRNPAAKKEVWSDLQDVMKLLGRGAKR